MWPNSFCSICLVSALMWIGRVVVLQPESSNHAPIHATISPPILPCVHIAENLWAPPLELWGRPPRADACALQAYAQLQAPSNHHLNSWNIDVLLIHQFLAPSALRLVTNITVFLVHGAWHFGIVVNRRTHSIKWHRHQQNHLRTCHCHWHKTNKADHKSTEI